MKRQIKSKNLVKHIHLKVSHTLAFPNFLPSTNIPHSSLYTASQKGTPYIHINSKTSHCITSAKTVKIISCLKTSRGCLLSWFSQISKKCFGLQIKNEPCIVTINPIKIIMAEQTLNIMIQTSYNLHAVTLMYKTYARCQSREGKILKSLQAPSSF